MRLLNLACSTFAVVAAALDMAVLNNGNELPLIGLGVGNMAHEQIPSVVRDAVTTHEVTFIDTASASRNERLIVAAVAKAGRSDVQIQTKVWYTHLGYGRTTLSVQSSLENLASSGAVGPVTVLLHWPRCNPAIPWMDCEGEEAALPSEVKAAGPAPHLEPNKAWVESWRALEDLHLAGDLHNIGVSNFDSADLFKLITFARVKPQILQGNVWSLVYDPALLTLCRDHGIVFQAYNVMNGLLSSESARGSPKAFQVLRKVGAELEETARTLSTASSGTGAGPDEEAATAAAAAGVASAAADTDPRCRAWALNDGQCFENPAFMLSGCATSCAHFRKDRPFAVGPAAVVLKWLAQQNVGSIPRAASSYHLASNGPSAIAKLPAMSDGQIDRVSRAARALLGGNDDGGSFVDATFEEEDLLDAEAEAAAAAAAVEGGGEPVVATFVNNFSVEAAASSGGSGDSRGAARQAGRVRGSTRKEAQPPPLSHEQEVHAKAATAAAAAAALVSVFWVHQESGEEVLAAGPLKPGEAASLHTHPGHTFVARPSPQEGSQAAPVMGAGHSRQPRLARFEVTAPAGGAQHFQIGGGSEEL